MAFAVRDTLGTATYFMTYESSKQLLTTFGGDGTHSNPLAVLVAGGLCGIVSWALICKFLFFSATPARSPATDLTDASRPRRLGKEHLPAQLPDVLQGPGGRARQDPVLPAQHVPRPGGVDGPVVRCQRRLFLVV